MTAKQHPTKRCDQCEYWVRGDQFPEEQDADRHVDDRVGQCHRNAPRCTVGDFEYQTIMFLSIMAWPIADDNEKKYLFNEPEEATLKTSSWPGTSGGDWCGEWKRREAECIEPIDLTEQAA